jgi:hypothetical protein
VAQITPLDGSKTAVAPFTLSIVSVQVVAVPEQFPAQ